MKAHICNFEAKKDVDCKINAKIKKALKPTAAEKSTDNVQIKLDGQSSKRIEITM